MGAETVMSQNFNPNLPSQRPVWQSFLIILGIDTLVVLLGALILGNFRQISNLYFMSSIILLIIAAVPIFTEVGSSAKIARRAVKEGEKVAPQLKEKQVVFERNAKMTYTFGLAGLAAFILSMLSLSIR
jgi:multisubunit Na+/H+ antiporter MnhE subunit